MLRPFLPIQPFLRIQPYFARWNGTLVTTVFGRKSSAPLMSNAR